MTPELTFFLYSDYLKLTLSQSYSMCLSFVQISLEDIQAFEKTYKGSEEELTDIKQAYLDFKGDMDQIMESVLCVQYTEEPRIRHIIQQAIDAGEVPSYNAFVKESKQKMNARKRRVRF